MILRISAFPSPPSLRFLIREDTGATHEVMLNPSVQHRLLFVPLRFPSHTGMASPRCAGDDRVSHRLEWPTGLPGRQRDDRFRPLHLHLTADRASHLVCPCWGSSACCPCSSFSPFASALVDRWNRKLTMMVSDIAGLVANLLMVALIIWGHLEMWHLYALAVFTASFKPSNGPPIPQPSR